MVILPWHWLLEMMLAVGHLDALLIIGSLQCGLPLAPNCIYDPPPPLLIVMAMESEAEALGQLTTNELDGKVSVIFVLQLFFTCVPFIILKNVNELNHSLSNSPSINCWKHQRSLLLILALSLSNGVATFYLFINFESLVKLF